jgi:hypothetical protein
VELAIDLKTQAAELPEQFRATSEIASNNLMRLTAMTMAGYHLYEEFRNHAANLCDDLKTTITVLEKVRPESAAIISHGALRQYESYMESNDNEQNI